MWVSGSSHDYLLVSLEKALPLILYLTRLNPRRSGTPSPSFLSPRRSNAVVRSPSALSQIQCRDLFSRTATPSLLNPVRSDSLVPSPSPLFPIQFRVLFSPPHTTTMDIPYRYSKKKYNDFVNYEGPRSMPHRLRYITLVGPDFMPLEEVRLKRRTNCLLQLYSIRFLESDREDLDQVCGTIRLDYYRSREVIFKRQIGQGHFEIDAEGFLRLSGPKSPISVGGGYNDIQTILYRENQHDQAPSCESGVGLSVPENFCKCPCDTLITDKIDTIFGTMEVAFANFSDAADSYLTIKLLYWRGDGFAPNIYGSIVASDTLCGDDFRAKSLVFDTKRDEEVLSVPVGHCIPLRRPINEVPMYHSLKLDICLYHKNNTGSRGDDPLILKSTLDFEPRCGDEVEDTIESKELSGKWCALQVTAHWLPYWSFAWSSGESSD